MINCAIIGCGGIGSWLSLVLHHMEKADQLKTKAGRESVEFTVFDPDIVEKKNCRHQFFFRAEVGIPKAMVVGQRHTPFEARYGRFKEEDLSDFSYYLLCVDNVKTRHMVFKHALAANKKFIDMRADGRTYTILTYMLEPERLMASLGTDKDSEKGFSCQRASDVVAGETNLGNIGVVPHGVQLFMDDLRGWPIPGIRMVNLNQEAGI